jgi:hypothetical protein
MRIRVQVKFDVTDFRISGLDGVGYTNIALQSRGALRLEPRIHCTHNYLQQSEIWPQRIGTGRSILCNANEAPGALRLM